MGRKKSWKKPKYPRSSRQESQTEHSQTLSDPTVFAEVESLFKKLFTFSPPETAWELPQPVTWFSGDPWTSDELMQKKEALNAVKSTLSDIEINQWHEHTQFTNRAGLVIQHVRRNRKPELCTQAWCKFHEIVASFPILPPGVRSEWALPGDESLTSGSSTEGAHLRTVHLCEAPGAFVASLNHYLKTRGYRGEWQWVATTLNPYYEGNNLSEMITDDRLLLDTLPNWYFGPDDSGNVTHPENIRGLRDHVMRTGPAHLVTCDGSVDCQNDPAHQEALVSPLHYSEVASSLLLLAQGGALVLKMFTLFESSSVCLMYLLNCLFVKVNVFKPATSKSGNSEVYVVCLGYKGCATEVTETLLNAAGKTMPSNPMFRLEDIPESYMTEHKRCCQVFTKLQTQTIEENLSLYHDMSAERHTHINTVRQRCAASFVDRFQIRILQPHSYVIPPFQPVGGQWRTKHHHTRSRACHSGSYSERQEQLQLSWQERLVCALPYDLSLDSLGWLQSEGHLEQEDLTSWLVTQAEPPKRVVSSQFCEPSVLLWYNELLSYHQVDQSPKVDFSEVGTFLESMCSTAMDEGQGQEKIAFVPLDSQQGPFVDYLSNSGIFQVEAHKAESDKTSRVFVSELGVSESAMDSWSERNGHLLKALLDMYQSILIGDHCVLVLPDLLTRFSAAVFYLLSSSFSQVCVKPISASVNTPLTVVGWRYRCEDKQPVLDWLTGVVETVNSEQHVSHVVLQIMPIHVLLESHFYNYVCTSNETVLKAKSDSMLRHQQEELNRQQKNVAETELSQQLEENNDVSHT